MGKLIWGSDLYKGYKLKNDGNMYGSLNDIIPFQMLSLEEKTIDWIKAVADYYETVGWNNVEKKAGRIQKNYWMRYGKLNQSDYIINPTQNEYYQAVGMLVPQQSNSPIEQFYPIIPNFIEVLRGEFIKRDNQWLVEAIDPDSISEIAKFKEDQFKEVIGQYAMLKKQQELAKLGLAQGISEEEYFNQMQAFQDQLVNVELESKKYRTTGQRWADKVVRVQHSRFNLDEIEADGFETGLITDSEYWHLDLQEDDFKLELLNPKWVDKHKGPNVKYVSQGDYFLWFDFMSAGDIVNKYGRRMKEEDLDKLKEIFVTSAALLVPDYDKARQGSYYDHRKSWSEATDLDPKMNDAILGMELAYNYTRSPNFDHNQDVDILNPVWGRHATGSPQMFRVMRLYWRSMRRIGWLTKINLDGTMEEGTWVDENYKVTIKPQYDKSILKEESESNLIYGEHIRWTWANEWRHVIKISPNQKHTFWMNSSNTYDSIYLDGGPVKFQFKGIENPFDSLPPVEGCDYSYLNTTPHGLVDRLYPLQVVYNICKNMVPKKILQDRGLKVAIDKRMIPQNNLEMDGYGNDPVAAFDEDLDNSSLLAYETTRESLQGLGQPALPTILNLSTVQEAQLYQQLAQMTKEEAGDIIGITRNRLGQNKASDTATAVNQGIIYSETQTEKYFEQHTNLMQRVRQRMLDAAQYYSTFSPTSRDIYMNSEEENVWLEVEGMQNLLAQYHIKPVLRANNRHMLNKLASFLEQENTLDIQASTKIKAIASQSMTILMKTLEEGEKAAAEKVEQQRQHELQMEEQRRETILAQQQMAFEQQMAIQESKNDSNETVATIRSLGGIQTDVNTNQVPDSQENLNTFFKQQDLINKSSIATQQIQSKQQIETMKALAAREKAQKELEKEKIKGDYALKVAKENKYRHEK